MWATITKPFAWLMLRLYDWTHNYGLSVILFALAVNLVLAPFMAKSKKSTMRTTRLQPKIQELQRRHEGNQQKLNQEMQKLYREEGINPMSGCIWSLIPFPILIALYSVIRQPLSRMMFVSTEVVQKLTQFFTDSGLYEVTNKRADAYAEIKIADLVHKNWDSVQSFLPSIQDETVSRLQDIDFGFLGMNMGNQPDFRFWNFDFSDPKIWGPALGLFLIPIVSALLSWLSMKVSNLTNPQQDAQTEASMKSMTLMMPLMSLWFCFIMPAAMGVYWIANSIFGMARDFFLTRLFKKQLDKEDAEKNAQRKARERELELNRLETERKHAEGTSEVNANTSKKKQKANEKQKSNERKAAIEKEERAARRERLGIEEYEKPASQVGNRRYARGRAYDPDRFGVQEEPVSDESSIAELENIEDVVLDEAEAVNEEVLETVSEEIAEVEEVIDETETEKEEN
jgi:membrane protein insertase, YidC/Oxa1 family, C-terminal domain